MKLTEYCAKIIIILCVMIGVQYTYTDLHEEAHAQIAVQHDYEYVKVISIFGDSYVNVTIPNEPAQNYYLQQSIVDSIGYPLQIVTWLLTTILLTLILQKS